MNSCAFRIDIQRNPQEFPQRSWASGGGYEFLRAFFGTLVVYPAIGYLTGKVYDVLTNFKFDLTNKQEAVQILEWAQGVSSTLLRTAFLTTFIFYVVILGPILEEVLFRGQLNSWVKSKFEGWGYNLDHHPLHKAFYWTICGTAFGAAHLSPTQGWTNLPIFIATSLMGVFFSYLKDERTNDLSAPIAAHILNNGISVFRLLQKV